MGEDIFEIFCEEVDEIRQRLQEMYPQWQQQPRNRELLTEIRRAFHTLKGSGRMAGAFALGDFGWVHEDLLNQVISGQLAADARVVGQIAAALHMLDERLAFFQQAQQTDAELAALLQDAQAILAGKQAPNSSATPPEPPAASLATAPAIEEEVFDFSAPLPTTPPAVTALPAADPLPASLALEFAPDNSWQTEPAQSAASIPLDNLQIATPAATVNDASDNTAESRLIWQLFWEEAPEQLQALDNHLQQLYTDPSNPETLRALERAFHTLKGGARMAQLSELADIAHHAEDLLEQHSANTALSHADMAALQQAVDRLQQLAEHYQQLPAPPSRDPVPASPEIATPAKVSAPLAPTEPLVMARKPTTASESGSMLERLLLEQADSLPDIRVLESSPRSSHTPTPDSTPMETNHNGHETIRVAASFVDGLVEQVVELNRQQVHLAEHFSTMGLDVDELIRTVARLRQQIRTLELESEAQIHDGRSQRPINHPAADGFDPLEMDQYAEIQRISRSLAESLNDLVNLEADLASQVRKGEQLLQADIQSTRNLQQALLSTRLVAVSVLVPRLRRLTRQVSTELGKQVILNVRGEECEIDRNLLQHLTAPLEHLIRNAIVHGIETPEERTRSGKPPAGTLTLSVQRDDNEIVLTCHDDGRGLNRERLYSKAVEMGLLSAGQTLPEAELDRLILRPGFSTATTVSQIAGRGIGMDVVYTELKALGGNLQIASTTGQGTTFTLRLPFTLVVNPVLLAEVQQQIYAIPLNGIQGLARLPGQALQQALQADHPRLEFGGEAYALRYLADALGAARPENALGETERYPLMFIEQQGQRLAWIVDKLRGRREVVLQPLGTLFKNCRLYSAATIAPDGSVFLVPDMAELARQVSQAPLAEQNAPNTALVAAEVSAEPARATRVMVVDDSVTVRRVTEKFLNTQAFSVLTAKDGMEALECIAEFQPDVVLMDIEMPRMDGFELLGHLRRDPQWQRLPIIMISSRTAQKHREHAAALGATGFLGKPYQNDVLLDAIQEVLASGHAADTTLSWEDAHA